MKLLRSKQLDQEAKIYYQSLKNCNKTSKKADLYENLGVRYEGLDASRITIVGKTPQVYKIQFLDCVTVTVCPAIVSVPVRVIPGLRVTRNLIDPLPLPTFAPSNLIQFELLLIE